MTPPNEPQFPCIGCGASIPMGSDICPGCLHRFREPGSALPGGVRFLDSDEPPRKQTARLPSLRIGTVMVLIAVVALCFGAFATDRYLGVLVSLILLPASLRLALVSARREAEGRPMTRDDMSLSFIATGGSTFLIAISSFLAFVSTCAAFREDMDTIKFSTGAGCLVAIIVGVLMIRFLLKLSRAEDQRERDWEALHGRRSIRR